MKRYRYRSVDNIIEELKELSRNGYKYVAFEDDSFLFNNKMAHELFDKIIKEKLGMKYIITAVRVDSADEKLFEKIRSMGGVDVVSMSRVERPKLDRDVHEFITTYSNLVKKAATQTSAKNPGTTSYVIVDIDKDAIQQVFTTVFFIDEVVFCDVIEGGSKLVGMITGESAVGARPRIVEKLNQIEGVLRVREAKVIKIMDE